MRLGKIPHSKKINLNLKIQWNWNKGDSHQEKRGRHHDSDHELFVQFCGNLILWN